MDLKIKGLFKAAKEYKQITEKFGVQNFYIDVDTDTEYPAVVEFQVNNNKIDLSQFAGGEEIEVNFNINGRKWEKDGRTGFAQNLTAWRITKTGESKPVEAKPETGDKNGDDLPF